MVLVHNKGVEYLACKCFSIYDNGLGQTYAEVELHAHTHYELAEQRNGEMLLMMSIIAIIKDMGS